MSGIGAIVNFDGAGISESEVERMANALKPYGADRQKILRRGGAAFVYCLDGLTPEDLYERQPLLIDNRFILLFDGRIDNRSELAEVLGIAASELNSTPDSVIVLRLFQRWQERSFARILGVFAVIVMDLQEGRLTCARDQMGLRVLHYHRSREKFAVATVPEALFALSWVPRVLNKDKVADTLVQRGLNGETTYYQDINRVLPGSMVHVRNTGLSKEQYWNPENIADVRFKSDEEYVEAFCERLESAVRANLRSRTPPCASITGGLDSSSIAVVAADTLAAVGKKLITFTAVPEAGFVQQDLRGRYFDETPYVEQIAQANPNIVPNFVRPSKRPILGQIAEQIRMEGTTSGGILNGLWVMDMLAAARSAGHNVMLSGDMGNLTMSYHGRALYTELFQTGHWIRLVREISSAGVRWRKRIRQNILAPLIPPPLFRSYKRWRRGDKPPWYSFSFVNADFAVRSGVIERAAREYMPFDAAPSRDGRLGRIHDFHSYSETADWFAKIRAGFRIDIRTPAFDRRLVEFCIGIPQDQYLRKGRERWLIRRAMKGRLPNIVLQNTKIGAQAADWYPRLTRERENLAEEVKRLKMNVEVASILDLPRLSAILDNWPNQQPAEYSDMQNLLMGVPGALGTAYFIESTTGTNVGR